MSYKHYHGNQTLQANMERAKVAYSPVRWDFAIVQDEGNLCNIEVVVIIAERLSARQLILQRRPISAGVCTYNPDPKSQLRKRCSKRPHL